MASAGATEEVAAGAQGGESARCVGFAEDGFVVHHGGQTDTLARRRDKTCRVRCSIAVVLAAAASSLAFDASYLVL